MIPRRNFLCGFPRKRADLFSPEIEPSISIVGMLLILIHQVSENFVAKEKSLYPLIIER